MGELSDTKETATDNATYLASEVITLPFSLRDEDKIHTLDQFILRFERFMHPSRPWALLPIEDPRGCEDQPMLRYISESGNLYCMMGYVYRRHTGRVVPPERWESLALALGLEHRAAQQIAQVGFGYYVPGVTEKFHSLSRAKLVAGSS